MKLLLACVILSLIACSCEAALLRADEPLIIQSGKHYNETVTCVDGEDCSFLFAFNMTQVTFRGTDRTVELDLTFLSALCNPVDDCGDFDASTGIRLLLQNATTVLPIKNSNFTAYVPSALVSKDVDLMAETQYFIQIKAPIPPAGQHIVQFSFLFEADWPTDTPAWVIVVLVAGSVLVLALLIAIAYCLYMRLCHKSSDYERFE
ncbi:MAG: hypothetical protein Q8P67_02535 [archaeon]|nr:hypothetical protein [archaeon]